MHSIIKASTIVVDEGAERAPLDGRECAQGPRVELVRIDGRVVALELRCPCGEVHVVEFDYAAETPAREEAA